MRKNCHLGTDGQWRSLLAKGSVPAGVVSASLSGDVHCWSFALRQRWVGVCPWTPSGLSFSFRRISGGAGVQVSCGPGGLVSPPLQPHIAVSLSPLAIAALPPPLLLRPAAQASHLVSPAPQGQRSCQGDTSPHRTLPKERKARRTRPCKRYLWENRTLAAAQGVEGAGRGVWVVTDPWTGRRAGRARLAREGGVAEPHQGRRRPREGPGPPRFRECRTPVFNPQRRVAPVLW